MHQPYWQKVDAPISVCDLSWTPKIKRIVDTKHTSYMVSQKIRTKWRYSMTYVHNSKSAVIELSEWRLQHRWAHGIGQYYTSNEVHIRHWKQGLHVTFGLPCWQTWGVYLKPWANSCLSSSFSFLSDASLSSYSSRWWWNADSIESRYSRSSALFFSYSLMISCLKHATSNLSSSNANDLSHKPFCNAEYACYYSRESLEWLCPL